jgi:hypothetical protein
MSPRLLMLHHLLSTTLTPIPVLFTGPAPRAPSQPPLARPPPRTPSPPRPPPPPPSPPPPPPGPMPQCPATVLPSSLPPGTSLAHCPFASRRVLHPWFCQYYTFRYDRTRPVAHTDTHSQTQTHTRTHPFRVSVRGACCFLLCGVSPFLHVAKAVQSPLSSGGYPH